MTYHRYNPSSWV